GAAGCAVSSGSAPASAPPGTGSAAVPTLAARAGAAARLALTRLRSAMYRCSRSFRSGTTGGGMKVEEKAPGAKPTNSTSARSFSVPTPSSPAPTNSSPATGSSANRGVDGPHQGLVDREVGRLRVGLPGAAQDALGVLGDLVEDHDGVVQRETEDGQ